MIRMAQSYTVEEVRRHLDMARNYFEIRNEACDRNTYKVTIASSQHFSLFDIRNSETDISRITI
jgi:hypothetical protein